MPQKVCFTSRNEVKNTIVKKHQKVKFLSILSKACLCTLQEQFLKVFVEKYYNTIVLHIKYYNTIVLHIKYYNTIVLHIK